MNQPKETVTFWKDGKLVTKDLDPTAFDVVVALALEPVQKHGPDVISRRRKQRRALWKIIAENPDLSANPAKLARMILDKDPSASFADDYKSLEIIIRRALKRFYEKSK